MCVSIAICYPTNIVFLWKTPQTSCLLNVDCYYLFRLINHDRGIKASACINHISSAVSHTTTMLHMFIEFASAGIRPVQIRRFAYNLNLHNLNLYK